MNSILPKPEVAGVHCERCFWKRECGQHSVMQNVSPLNCRTFRSEPVQEDVPDRQVIGE